MQKQKNKREIPCYSMVNCPACHKPRLYKRVRDGVVDPVSEETQVSIQGDDRFVDVCQFCLVKWNKLDKAFIKRQVRELQKASLNKTDSDIEI